jgi:uncharacterized Zn-binding protein involved in type VI secretion
MGTPAAKQGDKVVAIDTHVILIPSPGGPVPTPTPMPFNGVLSGNLSPDVLIENKPAATEGSTAQNTPAHVAAGGPFQAPPSNQGTVKTGSGVVLINNKKAAHTGDTAITCNDPSDTPAGTVIGSGTVLVGD